MQLLGRFPAPRIWLLDENESELIQRPKDAFIRNWRQIESTTPYPRYGELRRRFLSEFQEFAAFVDQLHLGSIAPRQCEVTYVNHIPAGHGWKDFSEIYKVVSGYSDLRSDRFLPPLEEARYGAKFAITDGQRQFLGRLTVSAATKTGSS